MYLLSTANDNFLADDNIQDQYWALKENFTSNPDANTTAKFLENEFDDENSVEIVNDKPDDSQAKKGMQCQKESNVSRTHEDEESLKPNNSIKDVPTNVSNTSDSNLTTFNSQVEAIPVIRNNYNKVCVFYFVSHESRHTGEVLIAERDRHGVFWKIIDDSGDRESYIDFDTFHPADVGYEISKIMVNGNYLFETFIEEPDFTKSLQIPTPCGVEETHSIIHDLDEVLGFCNGIFGIGLVTNCPIECNPHFSWYFNDLLFKSCKKLMWLYDIPTDKEYMWYCEIKCEDGHIMKSKTLKINEKYENSIVADTIEVPILTKSDFSVSRDLIGMGVQGKVFKGRYREKEDAVKVVKLFSTFTAAIDSEISVLETIII